MGTILPQRVVLNAGGMQPTAFLFPIAALGTRRANPDCIVSIPEWIRLAKRPFDAPCRSAHNGCRIRWLPGGW